MALPHSVGFTDESSTPSTLARSGPTMFFGHSAGHLQRRRPQSPLSALQVTQAFRRFPQYSWAISGTLCVYIYTHAFFLYIHVCMRDIGSTPHERVQSWAQFVSMLGVERSANL